MQKAGPWQQDRSGTIGEMAEKAPPEQAGPPTPPQPSPPWAWPRGRRPDPWPDWVRRAEMFAEAYREGMPVPAWLRKTPGEHRWPVSVTVVAAVVLQILLPPHLTQPIPAPVLPLLEGALLIFLAVTNPVRIERGGLAVRIASIVLLVLITFANISSAVLLIRAIIEGQSANSAMPLLASGANIWATNVIVFGVWYWEFDRGGPVHRALATHQHPDLMFPQMATPELAPPEWEPRFFDYLYLSFTNATAFSPTDVMPLARWAKATMLVQSAVSLAIGALVIARAINILK
jgi:hypothetical protein